MLAEMEQLRFFIEKDSVVDPKTAMLLTPAFNAASSPLLLGTRKEYAFNGNKGSLSLFKRSNTRLECSI